MLKQKIVLFIVSIILIPFALSASEKVTLITTLSPCQSYPRTIILEMTQYSFMRNIPNFARMPKVIVCDGAKNSADIPAYEELKIRLQKLVASHPHFQNTTLVFCSEHKCLVGAVREALKSVETEYVFLHQDDFELLVPLDLDGLVAAMDKNHNIKHVRLNSGINTWGKSNCYDRIMDDYVEGGSDFPLIRTGGWSDNDHIARKDYYENFVLPKIGEEKTFMEHRMHPAELEDIAKDIKAHLDYGTYLYGTFEEGPFIYHLDRKSSVW